MLQRVFLMDKDAQLEVAKGMLAEIKIMPVAGFLMADLLGFSLTKSI